MPPSLPRPHGVTTTRTPLLLAVYANATTASVLFTVPAGECVRLDIYEDQIGHVGHSRRDDDRFVGPPAPGLWIFDGFAVEYQVLLPDFQGIRRRPTTAELSHIAAGTWPGVQVGA